MLAMQTWVDLRLRWKANHSGLILLVPQVVLPYRRPLFSVFTIALRVVAGINCRHGRIPLAQIKSTMRILKNPCRSKRLILAPPDHRHCQDYSSTNSPHADASEGRSIRNSQIKIAQPASTAFGSLVNESEEKGCHIQFP